MSGIGPTLAGEELHVRSSLLEGNSLQSAPASTLPPVWLGLGFRAEEHQPRPTGTGAPWSRPASAGPTTSVRGLTGPVAPGAVAPFRSFANAAGAAEQEKRWERGMEVIETIKVRDEDLAEELAQGAVDHGATDEFGSTALILAARGGLEQLVTTILEQPGVSVNAQNHFGSTALICAATNGHLAICEKLLQHGADVDIRTRIGGTALGKAAGSGQDAVCRRLVEAGASLDFRTKLGDSAADLARKGGHQQLAQFLASSA